MKVETQAEQQHTRQIVCNMCGQPIPQVTKNHQADYLYLSKEWGYFSNKDLTKHTIRVCEACYDKWIQSFAIPPIEEDIQELFDFPNS